MTNDYDPNEKEGYKHQKAYWEEQERKRKLLQHLIDDERRKKKIWELWGKIKEIVSR
jgi:hypothetical protein